MSLDSPSRRADMNYFVGREPSISGYYLLRDGIDKYCVQDEAEFLFTFEKDLTIELQKLRSDLFFIHAAALEYQKRAIIFPASSGTGKSTFTWGLLQNELRYLSDELAPINLATMHVLPYPHALCLKSDPPAPYYLPQTILRTSRTLHVPVTQFADAVVSEATLLSAIFFLEYDSSATNPMIRQISPGTAAARLFSHALNPLAHSANGLEAAISIVKKVECFELHMTDLKETCLLVKKFLD